LRKGRTFDARNPHPAGPGFHDRALRGPFVFFHHRNHSVFHDPDFFGHFLFHDQVPAALD
jgi:hypothetical protein